LNGQIRGWGGGSGGGGESSKLGENVVVSRPHLVVVVAKMLSILSILCLCLSAHPGLQSANGQDSLELKYRIEEELPAGTVVCDVIRDANLARLYDAAALRQLQFRFLKQQLQQPPWFVIDSTTGVIRTQGGIDREAICTSADICEMKIDVVIQPQQHFRIIRITVTILDLNDNRPEFSDREQTVEVLESALVGRVLFIPDASDADSPEFGVQTYRLLSDSDRFALTGADRKPDGTFDTKLVIAKSLDRELVNNYVMQIVALDGGYPPKSGSVNLTVYVLDVNDNVPVFQRDSYEVSIVENISIQSTIIQVSISALL